MKIDSFVAFGVHETLDFDIKFHDDITFLIGINGSGKTSVLKLILGLTSPSFYYLNTIKFLSCKIICSSKKNERDIIITATQTEDNIQLELFNNGIAFGNNIKRVTRSNYDPDENANAEDYFENLEVSQMIRKLTTPKFLGLDRRIYSGNNIDFRFRNMRSYPGAGRAKNRNYEGVLEPQAIDVSLDEVQSLLYDYTRSIPQEQYKINDDFKQKMFNKSFDFIEDYNIAQPIPAKEIEQRKGKVLNAIDDLGIKGLKLNIENFFRKMMEIARDYEAHQLKNNHTDTNYDHAYMSIITKWYRNGTQLKRIDEIIKNSQDYQEEIKKLRAPFKKLETIVSNFLMEGRKELHIEANGEIKVYPLGKFNSGYNDIKGLKLNKEDQPNDSSTTIFNLSSGEKQIIIMIAHLIFEEAQKDSGIFIIDEPELSLHIAWQEIFVQSIMEASPKTQFILATHSPSIISKLENEFKCENLNKFK